MSSVNYKRDIGEFGEVVAINYLTSHGYELVNTNVKIRYKEIDIIVEDKGILVFVEVKTRISYTFGQADEAMTAQKINNLKQAAEIYLFNNNLDDKEVRLDFISVDLDKVRKTARIKHYKDIA